MASRRKGSGEGAAVAAPAAAGAASAGRQRQELGSASSAAAARPVGRWARATAPEPSWRPVLPRSAQRPSADAAGSVAAGAEQPEEAPPGSLDAVVDAEHVAAPSLCNGAGASAGRVPGQERMPGAGDSVHPAMSSGGGDAAAGEPSRCKLGVIAAVVTASTEDALKPSKAPERRARKSRQGAGRGAPVGSGEAPVRVNEARTGSREAAAGSREALPRGAAAPPAARTPAVAAAEKHRPAPAAAEAQRPPAAVEPPATPEEGQSAAAEEQPAATRPVARSVVRMGATTGGSGWRPTLRHKQSPEALMPTHR